MRNVPCGGSGTGARRVRADDGVVSRAAEVLSDILVPSDNFTMLEDRFRDKGLDPSGGGVEAKRWQLLTQAMALLRPEQQTQHGRALEVIC
jgi:hypothetical protein